MIDVVGAGRTLYSFEADFDLISLASARKLGLSDAWVRRFEDHDPRHRQVLSIDRLVAGSPASALLEPGDLVLDIDGKVVDRFREVERAVQKPGVSVTIWRDGAEKTLQLATVPLNGRDVDRVLNGPGPRCRPRTEPWHRSAASHRRACSSPSSITARPPAHYGLYAGRRIPEVDGQPHAGPRCVPLGGRGKPDRSRLRSRPSAWNDQTEVITLKLDKHYWPAYELDRQADGSWRAASHRSVLTWPGPRQPEHIDRAVAGAARRRAGRLSDRNRLRAGRECRRCGLPWPGSSRSRAARRIIR